MILLRKWLNLLLGAWLAPHTGRTGGPLVSSIVFLWSFLSPYMGGGGVLVDMVAAVTLSSCLDFLDLFKFESEIKESYIYISVYLSVLTGF